VTGPGAQRDKQPIIIFKVSYGLFPQGPCRWWRSLLDGPVQIADSVDKALTLFAGWYDHSAISGCQIREEKYLQVKAAAVQGT